MVDVDVLCFGEHWEAEGLHRHLLPRCARTQRVFFVEQPELVDSEPYLRVSRLRSQLWSIGPRLRAGSSSDEQLVQLRRQLILLALEHHIVRPIVWFMAPDIAPVPLGIAASLVLCGPAHGTAGVEHLSSAHRTLLGTADLILSEPRPADPVSEASWDAEAEAFGKLVSALLPSSPPRRTVFEARA
jgi:hypothetical protein